MKHTLLALVASVLSLSLQLARGQENSAAIPPEQAMLKLGQRWEDALTKSDTAALGDLFDDTIIYTHSNGKVDSKSS